MASSKAKLGVNSETNSLKESNSSGGGPAGEASPNHRIYCLDDLETVATVGELHVTHEKMKEKIQDRHRTETQA